MQLKLNNSQKVDSDFTKSRLDCVYLFDIYHLAFQKIIICYLWNRVLFYSTFLNFE